MVEFLAVFTFSVILPSSVFSVISVVDFFLPQRSQRTQRAEILSGLPRAMP